MADMPMVLKLIFFLMLLTEGNGKSSACSTDAFHIKDGIAERALVGRTFKNSTIDGWHSECFLECTMDCRCLSFVVCGKQCQLNADKKEMRNNSLEIKKGCTYYDLHIEQVNCISA